MDGYDFSVADDKHKRAKERKKKLATRNKHERLQLEQSNRVIKHGRVIQPYEEYTEDTLRQINKYPRNVKALLQELESDE